MDAKERWELIIKEVEGTIFYYVDVGSESHGRSTFRLWVHPSFVKRDSEGKPYLELPIQGVSLMDGKSQRTKILRPGNENLFHVYVPCGYRGSGEFEVKTPHSKQVIYRVYRSPRGSLGISKGGLITTQHDELVYEWSRTGRLYGSLPKGVTSIDISGKQVSLEETDFCEIEDLGETLSM